MTWTPARKAKPELQEKMISQMLANLAKWNWHVEEHNDGDIWHARASRLGDTTLRATGPTRIAALRAVYEQAPADQSDAS